MFYAAEDIGLTIGLLLALKQTILIVLMLLFVCYTRTYTDCLFFSISFYLTIDILCKLRFNNFLLEKDDNDDDNDGW